MYKSNKRTRHKTHHLHATRAAIRQCNAGCSAHCAIDARQPTFFGSRGRMGFWTVGLFTLQLQVVLLCLVLSLHHFCRNQRRAGERPHRVLCMSGLCWCKPRRLLLYFRNIEFDILSECMRTYHKYVHHDPHPSRVFAAHVHAPEGARAVQYRRVLSLSRMWRLLRNGILLLLRPNARTRTTKNPWSD